jgi:hypothetical protein
LYAAGIKGKQFEGSFYNIGYFYIIMSATVLGLKSLTKVKNNFIQIGPQV